MIVDFGPKCGIAVVQKLITNRKVASANLPPPPLHAQVWRNRLETPTDTER